MAKILVFIHGIGSNKDTWNKFIETINADNITKNIEDFTLNVTNIDNDKTYYYLYEYESKIIEKSNFTKVIKEKITGRQSIGDISVNKHAKTFEHFLNTYVDKFESINIIAHSMGGLILMEMLFNIIQQNKKLKDVINTCMLYGSPLNGSDEPNELKKLLKLDISTEVLNELKPHSNTIISLKQNIENNAIILKQNFNIIFIAGDSDSRIIDVKEEMINKFGKFIQISGGHSEIIQPNISSSNFTNFKQSLFSQGKNITKVVSISNDKNHNFKLNEGYLNKINDIGIKLTHPSKNNIYLNDIFIFQDLQDLENKKKVKISSKKLLNTKDFNKCLVFGEDVSGKSALSHTIQKKLNEENFIPIHFNAKNIKKSDIATLKKRMYLNLRKQYIEVDRTDIDDFIKNNKNKIIIIIDNLENLAIKNIKSKALFFNMLDKEFEKVLMFSNDSFEIEIMTKDEFKSELDNFKILKIKELGYKLRDKLVEKWIYIGDEEEIENNHLFEKKDEVSKAIETIVGNKFIPTYPLYIISLLQQLEAGTSNNLSGSAYAEFYHYLISQALGITNIKQDELDFYYSYLSFIAYYYFTNGRKELNQSEIENIHNIFSKKIHKKPFTTVINHLVTAKLIKKDGEYYSFGHNYIYYFFVAKYLSDNMNKRKEKEEIQIIISELIKRLYRPQFANIIIFFIHHSKTHAEYIIDEIINEAQELFNDIQPATLSEKELIKINTLIHKEIKTILSGDKNPQEHREEELELKDELEAKTELIGSEDEEEDEIIEHNEEIKELDIFGKLNLSMKLMEILGQITKNYYGSLEQEDKLDVLEELSKLGLRNLNWFLNQFNEFQELLEHDIKKIIEKKNIVKKEEIEQVSKRIIFDFAEIISIHFIKKISTSMASKNLFDTVETLLSKNNNEVMKLIDIAVKLEFSNGLHSDKIISLNEEFKNNLMAKELLKFLVINHLYKFDIQYAKKQKICKKLDIGIKNQKNILINKTNS